VMTRIEAGTWVTIFASAKDTSRSVRDALEPAGSNERPLFDHVFVCIYIAASLRHGYCQHWSPWRYGSQPFSWPYGRS
jgi:hypothetical protein